MAREINQTAESDPNRYRISRRTILRGVGVSMALFEFE